MSPSRTRRRGRGKVARRGAGRPRAAGWPRPPPAGRRAESHWQRTPDSNAPAGQRAYHLKAMPKAQLSGLEAKPHVETLSGAITEGFKHLETPGRQDRFLEI